MAGNYLGTDLRDIRFVLLEMVGFDDLRQIERFKDVSDETVEMILEESDRLSREVYAPVNASVDHAGGCKLVDRQVRAPREYHDAYKTFCEGGWVGLSLGAEYGGQDIPNLVRVGSEECFAATNPSLHSYPALSVAAARVIESFGTQEQRDTFMPKLVDGTWTGTMCLTEPHAGSDIGDISTSARLRDGKYYIKGTKQFISCGDHDMAENIIHLVLARAEGAPKGALGISLFLVPKYRINPDGSPGEQNDVYCSALEKKMGLKGSATTQLAFGDDDKCEGFLLGNEGEGLVLMFQMMYEERIGVATQAMSMGAMAYEYALQYAHERVQGADVDHMGDPNAPRVPIVTHPDVRRMLMECKAYIYAMRRLVAYVANLTDQVWNMERSKEMKRLKAIFELLIPVAKAYATDRGLDVTNLAMLVYGGYGYTQEYPVEQMLRDVKVTSVYEGTNGIQAIDLLLRNVLARRGRALNLYLAEVDKHVAAYGDNPRLKTYFDDFTKAREEILDVISVLQGKRQSNIHHLLCVAVPFMEMFGHFVSAHMLLWGAGLADEKLQAIFKDRDATDAAAMKEVVENDSEAKYYEGAIQTARFFVCYILPKIYGLSHIVRRGDQSPVDMMF